jgi:hypothetical protein
LRAEGDGRRERGLQELTAMHDFLL